MKQQVKINKYCKFYKTLLCVFLFTFFAAQQVVAMDGLLDYIDFNRELFDAEKAEKYLQNRKFKELKAYLDASSTQIDALVWMEKAVQGGSGLALYSLMRAKSVNLELKKKYVLTGRNRDLQNYEKQCVQLLLIVLYQSIWYAYLTDLPGYPDRILKIFQAKINTWRTNYFDASVGLFSLSQYIDKVFTWFTTYQPTNKWVYPDCPEKRSLLMQNSFWVTHCSITSGTGGLSISDNNLVLEKMFEEYTTFLESKYILIKKTILSGIKDIIQEKMKVNNLRDFVKDNNRLESPWIMKILKELPEIPHIHTFVSLDSACDSTEVVIDGSGKDDEDYYYDSSDPKSFTKIPTNQSVGFFKGKKTQGTVAPSSVGQIADDLCGMAKSLYRLTDVKNEIGWFDQNFENILNTAQPLHLFFAIRYIQKHWKENYLRNDSKFKKWAKHVMFFIYRVALDCIMTYALTLNEAMLTKFMDVFCKKIWGDYFYSSPIRAKLAEMSYQEIRGLVIDKVNELHASACKAEVKDRTIFPSCIWVSNVDWASSWGRGRWVLAFNNSENYVRKQYQDACTQYNREVLRRKVLEYLNTIFSGYETFADFFNELDPLKTIYLKDQVKKWRKESKIKK